MSESAIRAALETRLALLSPAMATAHENAAYTPVAGTPFQRCYLLRAQPENPVFGSFHRLTGVFQVSLFYPPNAGAGAAEARAKLLAEHFPRGLSLTASGVTLMIDREPYIMSGQQDIDRWHVPVRINYFSNIGA